MENRSRRWMDTTPIDGVRLSVRCFLGGTLSRRVPSRVGDGRCSAVFLGARRPSSASAVLQLSRGEWMQGLDIVHASPSNIVECSRASVGRSIGPELGSVGNRVRRSGPLASFGHIPQGSHVARKYNVPRCTFYCLDVRIYIVDHAHRSRLHSCIPC